MIRPKDSFDYINGTVRSDLGVSEHTGFPNPATDSSLQGLELAKLLVKHPSSTFFFRIEGEAWQEQGIFGGDIAIIDRVISPRKTDKVIWTHDDGFQISELHMIPEQAKIWGTVSSIIHQYRNRN